MPRRRMEIRLAGLAVLGVGLLLSLVAGLFVYMSVTSTPIHPDAQGAPSVTRSAPSPAWADAVERAQQRVRAGLAERNLPGVSVAVGAGGEIVWAEGFGWADLERRVKVAPDTRFRIGTASMMLTSAGVGLLLEDGRLALDEIIQTHVPTFPAKQWPVTLRQLMAHVGGVRKDAGDEEPFNVRCDQTLDVLPRFADAPLLAEPGTQYRHSTYSWVLVSAAVERAAGEPFFTFMRRHVFAPLGMNDTTAEAEPGPMPDQATYYFPRFAADTRYGPQDPDDTDFSCFSGAAAFLSTPSDLVRFGLAMNDGTLLRPATVQLLQAPQRLASGQDTGYGLGWDLETVTLAGTPTVVVGHDGEMRGGQVMSFLSVPGRDLVVAVTSNTSFADTFAIATRVAEAFVERAPTAR